MTRYPSEKKEPDDVSAPAYGIGVESRVRDLLELIQEALDSGRLSLESELTLAIGDQHCIFEGAYVAGYELLFVVSED
jgi:hypothetical protein